MSGPPLPIFQLLPIYRADLFFDCFISFLHVLKSIAYPLLLLITISASVNFAGLNMLMLGSSLDRENGLGGGVDGGIMELLRVSC